ncbi:endomucin isoform X5 [Antechinus flavipes]|uniref:endomucin isoform X5 n=1 Tax=Antechinus flavipes TaxID=38775 RepID=UPI002236924B|nr:endomucin isoform X5 [Antechinus flavipes]
MKLLQGTFLFLSICNLCHTQENQAREHFTHNKSSFRTESVLSNSTAALSSPTSIATVTTLSSPTILTSPSPSIGNNETIQTSVNTQEKQDTTVTTLTTSVGSSLSSLINPTLTDHILTSSTKKPENTLGMITTPYIKDQGSTKDSSNTSSFVTNSSYSSVILPVVIALIAITLSVFTLVGLYRMCWKTDPGTPDNGTDQPQSDKESVKLLTVKTISPEISEQSAQGKNKN